MLFYGLVIKIGILSTNGIAQSKFENNNNKKGCAGSDLKRHRKLKPENSANVF